MARRKLRELNLLDDFLMNSILIHKEIGETFSREILQIIFRKAFGQLKVTSQKVYPGSDTDKHGARLDVYMEEVLDIEIPEEAMIIDLEPNQESDAEKIAALPKRVRFYHAKIDTKALGSGENYNALKNVVVIIITPNDPFGHDLMMYTVKNSIKELPHTEYEDGARTLFLYTNGKICNVHEELKELLHYMEHSTEENATTDALKRIHKMVETIKMDEEVSHKYMKVLEREEMLIEKGQKMERENTERERQRADNERQRADNERQRADSITSKLLETEKELAYWKKRALGTS